MTLYSCTTVTAKYGYLLSYRLVKTYQGIERTALQQIGYGQISRFFQLELKD